MSDSCHNHNRRDWLFIVCGSLVIALYSLSLFAVFTPEHWAHILAHAVFDLANTMWWGVLIGIFFVGVLHYVPREFVISFLGQTPGLRGLFRATFAGLALDLCSHGILLVGMKLYERGARIGQVMAFLIASPWNSFSLTVILFTLIGLKWTLIFILMSAVVAIATGWLFDFFVSRGTLPPNPYEQSLPAHFDFWSEAKSSLMKFRPTSKWWKGVFSHGLSESKMILRWLLLGILLASSIQTFVSAEVFQEWFGPSLLGLFLTLIATTIIEVCSEGSTPIAADLLNRAHAPGNGFVFLMAGVATDYTEILGLKERTKSWKLALFVPLLSVPQILLIGYLMNKFG